MPPPQEQTVPPYDPDAEDHVLGVILLPDTGPQALARLHARLQPDDFYGDSNQTLWAACQELHQAGVPVDPVILLDHLQRTNRIEKISGGPARVHQLVALTPTAANVDYYAHIIRARRRDRDALTAGDLLRTAAYNGGLDAHPETREQLSRLLAERDDGAAPFQGMTHGEVMDEILEPRPKFLVQDLLEPGVVATIAGVPETHKSWLAAQIAIGVAQGAGHQIEILGKPVTDQGPVGYWWQDDSTRNELERVQTIARVHQTPRDLPVHWYINEGLTLPDGLHRLRATITQHGLALAVLDSFYNLARGVELKDTDAGQILAALKADVADPTGCSILIVDHMAWATETNRNRLRAYGDVFKNAAIRSGVYIDAVGTQLYVEIRGNNIPTLTRTPCYWDRDRLELRLVDKQDHVDPEGYAERILDFFASPEGGDWTSTKGIETAVTGRGAHIRSALDALLDEGALNQRTAQELSRRGQGTYWNLAHRDTLNQLFTDTQPDPQEPPQP